MRGRAGGSGALARIAAAGALLQLATGAAAQTAAVTPAPATSVAAADTRMFDVVAWTKERAGLFAKFKAAHPPQEAAIAAIGERTAALIAAYAPPAGSALDRPPAIWRAETAPTVVFDAPVAPRMVVVPAGEFTMGSPAGETGRSADEGPRARVRIAHPLAVSMFPITYGEYAAFVTDTRRKTADTCVTLENGRFAARKDRGWQNPGFDQTGRSPATCIAFADATAYAAWLSARTGQRYRLLSEAEYEYAERAGTTTAYWWGNDAEAGCGLVNGFDQDAKPHAPALTASACHDGKVFAAPLDTSKPNAFGLYDTAGNVASWVADCWRATLAGAAPDGAPRVGGDCRRHVVRGGSWADAPAGLRAASRASGVPGEADARRGFRVAREL